MMFTTDRVLWMSGSMFCALTAFVTAGEGQSALDHQLSAASLRPMFDIPSINLAATEPEKAKSPSVATKETKTSDEEWDIWGPVQMRSANPEPTSEFEIKNIFDYGTSSDDTDDDFEYEFELEYGIAENHELIFEIPVKMGDGAVNGNADITVSWHWRLWKEQDLLPAFALRNYIRLPSGYQSSGVDYELKGLITKSILENKWRLPLNPFLKSVNGHNEDDHRDFQWGFIAGTDYRLTDTLTLNVDYVHETGKSEGERNQHTAESIWTRNYPPIKAWVS